MKRGIFKPFALLVCFVMAFSLFSVCGEQNAQALFDGPRVGHEYASEPDPLGAFLQKVEEQLRAASDTIGITWDQTDMTRQGVVYGGVLINEEVDSGYLSLYKNDPDGKIEIIRVSGSWAPESEEIANVNVAFPGMGRDAALAVADQVMAVVYSDAAAEGLGKAYDRCRDAKELRPGLRTSDTATLFIQNGGMYSSILFFGLREQGDMLYFLDGDEAVLWGFWLEGGEDKLPGEIIPEELGGRPVTRVNLQARVTIEDGFLVPGYGEYIAVPRTAETVGLSYTNAIYFLPEQVKTLYVDSLSQMLIFGMTIVSAGRDTQVVTNSSEAADVDIKPRIQAYYCSELANLAEEHDWDITYLDTFDGRWEDTEKLAEKRLDQLLEQYKAADPERYEAMMEEFTRDDMIKELFRENWEDIITDGSIPNKENLLAYQHIKVGDYTPITDPDALIAEAESYEGELGPEAITSGDCGPDVTWDLTDGVMTISGTGIMFDYRGMDTVPWDRSKDDITQVVIEDGVTTVGLGTFRDCVNLTSVTIPASVTTIETSAFNGCSSLSEVSIPDSVTKIGAYTFSGCTSLTSISIPSGVKNLGEGAFSDCTGLTSLTVNSFDCAVHDDGVGGNDDTLGVPGTTTVFGYPGSTAEEFAQDFGYTFQQLEGTYVVASGDCGDAGSSLTWSLSGDGVLTISGSGRMKDYSHPQYAPQTSFDDWQEWDSAPWLYYDICTGEDGLPLGQIRQVDIGGDVTYIGEYAFTYSHIQSIALPEGLTEVGAGAFGSSELTSVTFPSTLRTIGGGAFTGCKITSLTIPEGVTTVSGNAFGNSGCAATTGAQNMIIFRQVMDVSILSRDCTIEDTGKENNADDYAGWDNIYTLGDPSYTVIRGYPGSTAEAFAQKWGYAFRSVDDVSGPAGTDVKLLKVQEYDGDGSFSGETSYEYNDDGLLVCSSFRSAKDSSWNNEYIYTYDEAGRLLNKRWSSDDGAYENDVFVRSYNDDGTLASSSYNGIVDMWTTEEYFYDENGLVVREKQTRSMGEDISGFYSFENSVDEQGNLTAIRHDEDSPEPRDAVFIYDSDGRMLQGYDEYWLTPITYTYVDDPYFCVRDETSSIGPDYGGPSSSTVRVAYILDSAGKEVESFMLGTIGEMELTYDEAGYISSAKQYWNGYETEELRFIYGDPADAAAAEADAPAEDGGAQTPDESVWLTVTGDKVNIRSGPGTEYESRGQLSRGATLVSTGKSGDWYQVEYNGGTGYIIEDYVILNTPAPAADSAQIAAAELPSEPTEAADDVVSSPAPAADSAQDAAAELLPEPTEAADDVVSSPAPDETESVEDQGAAEEASEPVDTEPDDGDMYVCVSVSEFGDVTFTYDYDAQGNRISATDASNGNVTEYTYDEQGNVLEERSPGGSITLYEYNSAGQLTSEKLYYSEADLDNDNVYDSRYDIKYDEHGNMTYYMFENFNNRHAVTIEYEYDENGNILEKFSMPPHRVVYYEYDDQNRMIKSNSNFIDTFYEDVCCKG